MKVHALLFMGILAMSYYTRAVDVLFNNQQTMQGLVRIKGIIPGCTTGRQLRDLYKAQTGIGSNWPLYVAGLRLLDDTIIREGMQELVFSFKHPSAVRETF